MTHWMRPTFYHQEVIALPELASQTQEEPTEAPPVAPVEEVEPEPELDVFVPPDQVLLASNGRKIAFPKLSWRLEAKICKIIGRLVQEVPELKNIDYLDFKPSDFVSIASELLVTAPDYIDELIMLAYPELTESDLDTIHLEDVVDLLIPLFYAVAESLFMLMAQLRGQTSTPSAA